MYLLYIRGGDSVFYRFVSPPVTHFSLQQKTVTANESHSSQQLPSSLTTAVAGRWTKIVSAYSAPLYEFYGWLKKGNMFCFGHL